MPTAPNPTGWLRAGADRADRIAGEKVRRAKAAIGLPAL